MSSGRINPPNACVFIFRSTNKYPQYSFRFLPKTGHSNSSHPACLCDANVILSHANGQSRKPKILQADRSTKKRIKQQRSRVYIFKAVFAYLFQLLLLHSTILLLPSCSDRTCTANQPSSSSRTLPLPKM